MVVPSKPLNGTCLELATELSSIVAKLFLNYLRTLTGLSLNPKPCMSAVMTRPNFFRNGSHTFKIQSFHAPCMSTDAIQCNAVFLS